MFHKTDRQLNREQIKAHLKSAVMDLTPNVLDKIDLSVPQMAAEELHEDAGRAVSSITVMRKRMRVVAALAAACLCMVAVAGGTYTYRNGKVDSVIGIDVNPSVELSVNRKNRVLEAAPLNEDAKAIMEDMNLKGVDLNVAVNAVIGSMVTHGYLDDLDNAILVTVSNDSVSKASALRSSVVNDIQSSLEENQVKAVVYDQQVIEEDHVKALADNYGISYGKAYFLKELIDQNPALTMEDMEKLAPLTMEEIAKEITERSYAVGGHAGVSEDMTTTAQTTTQPVTTVPVTTEATTEETTTAEESETETGNQTTAAPVPQTTAPAPTDLPVMTTEAPTTEAQVPVSDAKIKIDYVDYENGVVTVNFKTKVKWKNPTVSVKDEGGTTYSAMVGDTDSSTCEIYVSGLEGGTSYTFVLGGISPKNGKQTTVKGTFETPVIGDGDANEEPVVPPETEETKETETQPQTTESSEASATSPAETESVPETESTQATEPPTEAPAEPQTQPPAAATSAA